MTPSIRDLEAPFFANDSFLNMCCGENTLANVISERVLLLCVFVHTHQDIVPCVEPLLSKCNVCVILGCRHKSWNLGGAYAKLLSEPARTKLKKNSKIQPREDSNLCHLPLRCRCRTTALPRSAIKEGDFGPIYTNCNQLIDEKKNELKKRKKQTKQTKIKVKERDRVTRSGDFARKTHFNIFFRALKLVFRAKREKLYIRRFLGFNFF